MENITLTKELVKSLRTRRGGFTNSTLTALGIGPKPSQGWPARLVGTTISRAAFDAAMEGRGVFVGGGEKTTVSRGAVVQIRAFAVGTNGNVFVTLSNDDRLEVNREQLQTLLDTIRERTEDAYVPAFSFCLNDDGTVLLTLASGQKVSISPDRAVLLADALNGAG